MKSVFSFAIVASIFCRVCLGFDCAPEGDAEKLNIHIVAHTHDDVGWLKTVDEYYYGANNSIQHAGVQYILDSVIPALKADPTKKFIYVEIAFFKRWWDQQNNDMKETVRNLVNSKQLEFINAGWCMNDEASTHYNAIIDQMTLGLKFVQDTFGDEARPRIAWHIDPFGHSNEQASLFAQMSFDGFFFGRIDYADKQLRLKQERMEMVWRGSKSGNLGQSSDIFTGVLYNGYNPPPGFCFDQFCDDQPMMKYPNLQDMNVKQKTDEFIRYSCGQAKHYKSNNIMITMGSDFMYENANLWFKNLDILMENVNKDMRVSAFYSTPTQYLDALHNSKLEWGLKTDDFFPYADCPHCYWTGYFTSRPTLKRYVRYNNNLLQACKQLEVFSGTALNCTPSSDLLRRAMAVAQHHDAVSGTSKQHVADDYAKRLAIGADSCQSLMSNVLGKYSVKDGDAPVFTFCDLLNVSSCALTETSNNFVTTIYNPLARAVTSNVRLPVVQSSVSVFNPQGEPVKSQVLPISKETKEVRILQKLTKSTSSYELVFQVTIPALGFSSYFVNVDKSIYNDVSTITKPLHSDETLSIENEFVKLDFDSDSGLLTTMTNLQSKISTSVSQNFFWYNASVGDKKSVQPSGAYIFRPNSSTTFPVSKDGKATISIIKGPLVQEVRQVFSPYISQVVRLYSGEKHADFEYTVGPIPTNDHLGKEIISRFDTDIKSNGVFYTDANGREMQERRRDFRPTWELNNTEPVAGNYYPVNSRMFIKDSNKQFTVLTERSLGGASMKDGSVEIMVHRRLLVDDKRGVAEPLDEPGISGEGLIARGKLSVVLAAPSGSAVIHRQLGESMLLEPIIAFTVNPSTVDEWISQHYTHDQGLKRELPENVHLLTLETWDTHAIIRVEHQFEAGEDAKFSKSVNISFAGLFTDFDIESMEELNLSANQKLKDKKPLKWNIKTLKKFKRTSGGETREGLDDGNPSIVLKPMEIRTFKVQIKYHNMHSKKRHC